MNKTDKARILDIDGNCLAIFHGYAWPGLAAIIAAYPAAFKVRILDRRGETRATIPVHAK